MVARAAALRTNINIDGRPLPTQKVPRLLRPSAPSHKRPYSPSSLRALESLADVVINIIIIITPCSAEGAVLISTSQSQFRLLAYTVPLDLRFCQVYSFGPYLLLFSVRNTDTHTLLSFTQYRKTPQDQDPTAVVHQLRWMGRATHRNLRRCANEKWLWCTKPQ